MTAKGGSLLVTVGVFSPPTYRTEALSPVRFRSADKSFPFEIEFQAGGADSPLAVRVQPQGGKPFPLKRVQLASPTPEELKQFAGSFFSDELQTTYRIEHIDGQLVLRSRNAPDSPLKPTVQDTFKARRPGGNLTLSFVRGPDDRVSGFDLAQAGGVKNMCFIKR